MKAFLKASLITGALALAAAPALALAGVPENQGTTHPHGQANAPNGNGGQGADHTPKGHAYGWYCKKQGASKKHVKGEKGTEFSRCVRALKQVDNSNDGEGGATFVGPGKACRSQNLSKKHVKGEKGTEFSRCVTAAAHLLRDQRRQSHNQG